MIVNHNAALGASAWLSSADNSTSAKADSAASFAAMLRQSQPQAPSPAPTRLQAPPPVTTPPAPQPTPQTQKQASAPAPQPTRPAAGMPNSVAPEAAAAPPSTQAQTTGSAQQSDDAGAAEQNTSARANASAKPKARVADKPTTSAAPKAKPAADATDAVKPAETADANQPTAASTATTVDPTLAQFLASLQIGRAPAASTGLSLAARAAKDAAATAEGDSARSTSSDGKALQATTDLSTGADAARSELGDRDAKGAGASFAALLDQHGTEAAAGATPAAGDSQGIQAPTALFGAIAATSNGAASSADSAPAPTSVNVPTPVDSPDFPQALGVQLSVLARDGIQHAELHLNPTDMGPVSVVIAMDGTQARIDFGADVAATRHAIESGLPELASALRDAGFTLTGGGVSQQASQQQSSSGRGDGRGGDGEGRSRSVSGGGGSDAAEPSAGASRRTVSNGGLDLYA
ncbi:hypothetical protein BH11PSE8_BH11PSE8_44270 [soil metagenome]